VPSLTSALVIDSEALYHAGQKRRYAVIVSVESGPALERWIASSSPNSIPAGSRRSPPGRRRPVCAGRRRACQLTAIPVARPSGRYASPAIRGRLHHRRARRWGAAARHYWWPWSLPSGTNACGTAARQRYR